jgi:hypothetical protein
MGTVQYRKHEAHPLSQGISQCLITVRVALFRDSSDFDSRYSAQLVVSSRGTLSDAESIGSMDVRIKVETSIA